MSRLSPDSQFAPAAPSALRRLRQLIDRKLFLLDQPVGAALTLTQRRIYVLPSAAGLVFSFTLLLMLVAAINYNLSLGYALIFVLAGATFISTWHAFRNLLGLRLQAARCAPVFAGGTAELGMLIDNPDPRRRPALTLIIHGQQASTSVAPQTQRTLSVSLHAPRRGELQAGRCVLETFWPLGFIRAWTVFQPALSCIVYPAPEAHPPALPETTDNGSGQRSSKQAGSDDFASLSPFQDSDSPRHIAWKVLARGGPLMVKRFSASSASDLLLDWAQLPAQLDTEQRLSRLCAWLLAAERSGRRYALRLPEQQFDYSQGSAHLHNCLQALALHGQSAAEQKR